MTDDCRAWRAYCLVALLATVAGCAAPRRAEVVAPSPVPVAVMQRPASQVVRLPPTDSKVSSPVLLGVYIAPLGQNASGKLGEIKLAAGQSQRSPVYSS